MRLQEGSPEPRGRAAQITRTSRRTRTAPRDETETETEALTLLLSLLYYPHIDLYLLLFALLEILNYYCLKCLLAIERQPT